MAYSTHDKSFAAHGVVVVADTSELEVDFIALCAIVSGAVTSRTVQGEYSVTYAGSSVSGGSITTEYARRLDAIRKRLGLGVVVDVDL